MKFLIRLRHMQTTKVLELEYRIPCLMVLRNYLLHIADISDSEDEDSIIN